MPRRKDAPRRSSSRSSSRRRGSGSGGSCCATLLTCAVLIGLAIFLAVYLNPNADSPKDLLPEGWDPSNFHPGDFIPDLEDFGLEDPYNASTPEDANRWVGTNGRGGLTLELVNALDSDWHGHLQTAVAEWDAGSPDALTLSLTMADQVDPDCRPIRGKMKVCNGNYGDTRWKGINVVSLVNEKIIESSAKMNEFYLANGGDDKRQYTMCHEIGHGFGLPHTDENFNNRNTGECMDYTRQPGANKSPGPENFIFLEAMYGTVDGGATTTTKTTEGDGGERKLLRSGIGATNSAEQLVIPTHLVTQVREAVRAMEARNDGKEHLDGWTEEHRSEYGSRHSRDFGNGVKVRVSKLLATPDDL